jgi:hypothetical protein
MDHFYAPPTQTALGGLNDFFLFPIWRIVKFLRFKLLNHTSIVLFLIPTPQLDSPKWKQASIDI